MKNAFLILFIVSVLLIGSVGNASADSGTPPDESTSMIPIHIEGYTGCVTWSETMPASDMGEYGPAVKFVSCRDKLPTLSIDRMIMRNISGSSSMVQYAPPPTYKCPLGYRMTSSWEFQQGSNIRWLTSYQQEMDFKTWGGATNNVARYFSYTIGPLGANTQIYATRATAASGSVIAGRGTSCSP
jgi:hypothetical protein